MGVENSEIFEDITTDSDQREGYPPMYRVILHNDDYTTKF